MVKVIQMFTHIFDNMLHRDVDCIFYDALVQVADYVLDDTKLLEKLTARIQNFMRENVFFTVYPEIWESLLG